MNKQIVRILSLSLLLSIPCGSQLIAAPVAEADLQYWKDLYNKDLTQRFSDADLIYIAEFQAGYTPKILERAEQQIAEHTRETKEEIYKKDMVKKLYPSIDKVKHSAVYARRNNYLFKGGEKTKFSTPEGTYNAALGTIKRIQQEALHIYAAINTIDAFTAQESKGQSRVQALAETIAKNTSYIKRLSTLLTHAKDAYIMLPEEYQKRAEEVFARETSRAKEHSDLVKSIAEKEVEELKKKATEQQKDIKDMLASTVLRNLSELDKSDK